MKLMSTVLAALLAANMSSMASAACAPHVNAIVSIAGFYAPIPAKCDFDLYHSNGSRAFIASSGDWYAPNGAQVYFASADDIYYPNGAPAFLVGGGGTWHFEDGRRAYYPETGTWYHANGVQAYYPSSGNLHYDNGTVVGRYSHLREEELLKFVGLIK